MYFARTTTICALLITCLTVLQGCLVYEEIERGATFSDALGDDESTLIILGGEGLVTLPGDSNRIHEFRTGLLGSRIVPAAGGGYWAAGKVCGPPDADGPIPHIDECEIAIQWLDENFEDTTFAPIETDTLDYISGFVESDEQLYLLRGRNFVDTFADGSFRNFLYAPAILHTYAITAGNTLSSSGAIEIAGGAVGTFNIFPDTAGGIWIAGLLRQGRPCDYYCLGTEFYFARLNANGSIDYEQRFDTATEFWHIDLAQRSENEIVILAKTEEEGAQHAVVFDAVSRTLDEYSLETTASVYDFDFSEGGELVALIYGDVNGYALEAFDSDGAFLWRSPIPANNLSIEFPEGSPVFAQTVFSRLHPYSQGRWLVGGAVAWNRVENTPGIYRAIYEASICYAIVTPGDAAVTTEVLADYLQSERVTRYYLRDLFHELSD